MIVIRENVEDEIIELKKLLSELETFIFVSNSN
jgi:hypothetical protein